MDTDPQHEVHIGNHEVISIFCAEAVLGLVSLVELPHQFDHIAIAVLIPHWHTKNNAMRRVRQRIGAVMKWAVAQRYRDDCPAGDAISAAPPKTRTVRNHRRTLPFAEVGAALDKVRVSSTFTSTVLALEFLVLMACRSSEVWHARWDEADLESETWTVPANRMKAKRDHRVPLSARALQVLHEAPNLSEESSLVFHATATARSSRRSIPRAGAACMASTTESCRSMRPA